MTPQEIAALPYRPCVGVVLARADGRVFAAERIDMPGEWQMPQGGIDSGEDIVTAGLRELEEETGVGPELVRVEALTDEWLSYDLPAEVLPYRGKYRGQTQKWLLTRFLGDDADIAIEGDHAEFRAWAWMTPNAIAARIVDFKRPVYAAAFAAFSTKL